MKAAAWGQSIPGRIADDDAMDIVWFLLKAWLALVAVFWSVFFLCVLVDNVGSRRGDGGHRPGG